MSLDDILKPLFVIGALGVLIYTVNDAEKYNNNRSTQEKSIKPPKNKSDKEFYASLPVPEIGYNEIIEEIDFSDIRLSSRSSHIGRIQRALCYQNVTRAVEEKYGLPKNILQGQAFQESEADPTQPNRSDDSGLGYIHMQPLMATHYGLNVIFNSTKLIDKEQGKEIRRILKKTNHDLRQLIEYDDRFHVIKNVDAAGRMLADNYSKTQNWNEALRIYSGRSEYPAKIREHMRIINNPNIIAKAERDFNQKNKHFIINGHPITFKEYIGLRQQLNYNYGLAEYEKMPKYPVTSSQRNYQYARQ